MSVYNAGSLKKQENSRKKNHLFLLYWLRQSLWLRGSQLTVESLISTSQLKNYVKMLECSTPADNTTIKYKKWVRWILILKCQNVLTDSKTSNYKTHKNIKNSDGIGTGCNMSILPTVTYIQELRYKIIHKIKLKKNP